MSEAVYDAVARIARHEAQASTHVALAEVTDVHTTGLGGADHAVTVRLRDSHVVVPRVPVVVGALGFVATPATGDLVLVVFADGDRHGGVVVGRLYHRDLAPPPHSDGQLVLQLPPGDTSPAIDVLADPTTPHVVLTVGDATVEVTGKTATITIGEARIAVDGNGPESVTVTAGEASLALTAGGDITLEAARDFTLKANRVVVEAQATVSISGATVDVN